MAVVIADRQFWLWRAVDDEGEVLDLLVQRRRDKAAAVKLIRKLSKKTRLRARRAGDRQAALLRCGKVRNGIVGSAQAGVAQEQSGREFVSTDTTARA
jgi:transposase-like protein